MVSWISGLMGSNHPIAIMHQENAYRQLEDELAKEIEHDVRRPAEVLAVAKAHSILEREMKAYHQEASDLEVEIRAKIERRRQCIVALTALMQADATLVADMQRGEENRIPVAEQPIPLEIEQG